MTKQLEAGACLKLKDNKHYVITVANLKDNKMLGVDVDAMQYVIVSEDEYDEVPVSDVPVGIVSKMLNCMSEDKACELLTDLINSLI